MEDICETPPLTNVEINDNNKEEDDLFESAVQEIDVSLKYVDQDLESMTINDNVLPSRTIHSPSLEEVATEPTNNIYITVTEPQKIGEGMSSYVMYKVITKTNMPVFSKQEFSVLRRFSDFLGLHEKLCDKYLRSGRIIPPAPEKNIKGTTKIKMSSTPSIESASVPNSSNNAQSEFLEKRRSSLERFLNRISQHPVLCVDQDFRDFLESESELPRATSTSALSGAGVLRLFNKVGETVNKITYRMDETDPWFSGWEGRLDNVETCLRNLMSGAEALVTVRREGAVGCHGAARGLAALAGADPHPALSRALSHLSDLHEKIENLRIEQSNTDYFLLYESIKEYIGLIGAIKDVFHERVKVYQNWQHAQMQLTKRRENKAKAELANRTDKIEQASAEIIEWEAKVDRSRQEFESISRVIKKDVEYWETQRVQDIRETIKSYLTAHIQHQAQAIQYWESFLPEAKSIK